LSSFLPLERRPVYIIGELHGVAANASVLEKMFQDYGWAVEFLEFADDQATFRACSPAALPLLASMASVPSPHTA
jgi:hypothetical protein